jgi:predicted transcriptional regulator
MMSNLVPQGETPQPIEAPADSVETADMLGAAVRLQSFMRAVPGKFRSDVFGDAALMILLDLFVAEHERRRLPIKSVCIGSGVPQSTALRYIERLESAGLIKRHANPADRRSAHIALTEEAGIKLHAILGTLFSSS